MRRLWVVFLLAVTFPLFGDIDEHTITASGQGKQMVRATIADVRVGVETQARTAQEVESAIGQGSRPLINFLQEKSQVEKLEVGAASIYPEYSKGPSPVILQYRGNVQIAFSTPVAEAGKFIDALMQQGANRLYGVTVRPTEQLLREARLSALKEASLNAREEIQTVLQALGLEEKEIVSVTVGEKAGGFQTRAFFAKAATSEESLEIVEQDQEVSATVSLKVKYD